jgi:hypothetical protein
MRLLRKENIRINMNMVKQEGVKDYKGGMILFAKVMQKGKRRKNEGTTKCSTTNSFCNIDDEDFVSSALEMGAKIDEYNLEKFLL